MIDIFEFEELIADMLDITDDQREDGNYLEGMFFDKFEIDFELAYEFTKRLLLHTSPVQAGFSKKHFHAFVSKNSPVMLMRTEFQESNQ